MILLDGKKCSVKILEEVKSKVKKMEVKPHLVVIIVGDDYASKIYVRNKKKAAESVGIKSTIIELPEGTNEAELLTKIDELNKDNDVTGIMVQLPLPKHINKLNIISAINPKKDVDGFTPENTGRLSLGLEPYFYPATPQGIMMLLDEYSIELEGADAVILGRSNIVGKPMAQMLLKRNATVTQCHSFSKNIEDKIKTADIVISAVGKKFVRCKMVNNKSVIVDVGINRDNNGQLTGDVDFDYVSSSVGYITPVPGGVGPMTIASLIYNSSKIYR